MPEPADVPQLVELWAEARRAAGPAARAMGSASESAVRHRVERASHDADVRLVVAELDDTVVGLACLSREPVAPFEDATCIRVAYLHVAEAARRRGAGSALVDAAATFAEEVGAPEIMVAVPPSAARGEPLLRPARAHARRRAPHRADRRCSAGSSPATTSRRRPRWSPADVGPEP